MVLRPPRLRHVARRRPTSSRVGGVHYCSAGRREPQRIRGTLNRVLGDSLARRRRPERVEPCLAAARSNPCSRSAARGPARWRQHRRELLAGAAYEGAVRDPLHADPSPDVDTKAFAGQIHARRSSGSTSRRTAVDWRASRHVRCSMGSAPSRSGHLRLAMSPSCMGASADAARRAGTKSSAVIAATTNRTSKATPRRSRNRRRPVTLPAAPARRLGSASLDNSSAAPFEMQHGYDCATGMTALLSGTPP